MNVSDCIKMRRSIRKYKPDHIDHSIIDSIISIASYSPSWKNTQITRYIAIEDPSILKKIADDYTPVYNSNIIRQIPMLVAVTFIKSRSGFERDGSYSTKKGDRWQMFDVGVACQSFCLAAKEQGLGTVIMGIFDEEKMVCTALFPADAAAPGQPRPRHLLPGQRHSQSGHRGGPAGHHRLLYQGWGN